eukprot:6734431-Prymnesium_polylepis.1
MGGYPSGPRLDWDASPKDGGLPIGAQIGLGCITPGWAGYLSPSSSCSWNPQALWVTASDDCYTRV